MNDDLITAAEPRNVNSTRPGNNISEEGTRYGAPKSPSAASPRRAENINGTGVIENGANFNINRSDSEAETVVSPSKKENQGRRDIIKAYELKQEPEYLDFEAAVQHIEKYPSDDYSVIPWSRETLSEDVQHESVGQSDARQPSLKRKRRMLDERIDRNSRDGSSSNLSSTVSSPVREAHSSKATDTASNRSRSSPPIDSIAFGQEKSTANRSRSGNDKFRILHRRDRKERGSESVTARKRRDTRSASHYDGSTNRSESPPSKNNTRAQSIHSAMPAAGVTKRKKAPAPLHVDRRRKPSEDLHQDSDDDSSIQSHHHNHKINSIDNSVMSPAKMVSHKKNRDRNGRTLLARACAQGIKEAEQWLKERPQDLDVPDNAGNTPLQIAALEGDVDVVQLLLEAGCDINCRNIDKDTPLIDAIENGHLEVVRMLLNAGSDPRQTNAKGAEPIDLVPTDSEDADEIRAAILASKRERNAVRRPSEDNRQHSMGSRDIELAASSAPGISPITSNRSPPPQGLGARRRTARSQPTDDALLWVNATPARLRDAAGKGDLAIVDHILKMKPQADTESIIAAARGGHDVVLEVMLAIAAPDADPEPLRSADYKPGHNTPMLAAIGRGNVSIINLLLSQPGFDPTRRMYKGLTYYEIAKDRQGSDWQEEYDVLKEAYESFKRSGGRKSNNNSPRKVRPRRADSTKSSSELSSSPHEIRKPKKPSNLRDETSDRDKDKRDTSSRGIKKTSSPALASDHESGAFKPPKVKVKPNSPNDKASPPLPSKRADGVKPKSRLMSGNEIKRDREIKRRASLAAEADLPKKAPGDPNSRTVARHRRLSEASEPRMPAIQNEAPNVTTETGKKRHRSSISPQANKSDLGVGYDTVSMKKRQRVNSQGSAADPTSDRSFHSRPPAMVANMVPNPTAATSSTISQGTAPIAFMGNNTSANMGNNNSNVSVPHVEASTTSQQNTATTSTLDTTDAAQMPTSEAENGARKDRIDSNGSLPEHTEQGHASPPNGLHKPLRRQQSELERQQSIQAQEERLDQELRLIREEHQAREEKVKAQRQAQLQMEQEQEAARIAKIKQEEEAARRRIEQERLKREEQERKRREMEEREILRRRKIQEEEERRRVDALPNALRRAAVQSSEVATSRRQVDKWFPLIAVETRDLQPQCDPQIGEERWLANIQVAPILGIKDLDLPQCRCPFYLNLLLHTILIKGPVTAWARIPATLDDRGFLWRVLRSKLPFYLPAWCYGGLEQTIHLEHHARRKFFAIKNVFWIKLSDFKDIVPRYDHLSHWKGFTVLLGHHNHSPSGPFGNHASGNPMTFDESTRHQDKYYAGRLASQRHPFGVHPSGQDLTFDEWQQEIERTYPRLITET